MTRRREPSLVDAFAKERRRARVARRRACASALARFEARGLPTAARRGLAVHEPRAARGRRLRAGGGRRPRRRGPREELLGRAPSDGPRLVFVNGRLAPRARPRAALPAGAMVASLADALARAGARRAAPRPARARRRAPVRRGEHGAHRSDGAFVHLPAGAASTAPIHCSSPRDRRRRPLRVAPAHARRRREGSARDARRERSLGEGAYFTNAVTEVVAGRRRAGRPRTARSRSRGARSTSATCRSRSSATAVPRAHALVARRRARAQRARLALDGRGRRLRRSNGLYMADGDAALDNHTCSSTRRRTARATSSTRACSTASARGVFNGQIPCGRMRRRPTRSRRTATCCSPSDATSTRSRSSRSTPTT